MTINITQNNDLTITLTWPEKYQSTYHYIWLRDNCPCCRHPQTNHRIIETSTLPLEIVPIEVSVDETLKIIWPDKHVSFFSFDWLKKYDYTNYEPYKNDPIILWNRSNFDQLPSFDFSPMLNYCFSGKKDNSFNKTLHEMLEGFYKYGVIFIKNIPTSQIDVIDIASMFGYIRETNWGKTYHVKSYANANSVAYTNLSLFGHTDDPYRDPIATAQLSLFIKNSSTGGESTMCDGFKIAQDMKLLYPKYFKILTNTPVHFYLKDKNNIFESIKTIIELDCLGDVRCIRYSNHSAQPFNVPVDQMYDFYTAYQMFASMRENPKYKFEIKMNEGDFYMIDNTRILHGRSEYSVSNGERDIHGCFMEKDQILSQLKLNESKQGDYWKYWLKMARY
jgi:gamma-butyrobetaine dioxygenase